MDGRPPPLWNMNQWEPWDDWNSWDQWSWDGSQEIGYENWGGKQGDDVNAVTGKGKGYQNPFYGIVKNVD